jgi:hypothetical protein
MDETETLDFDFLVVLTVWKDDSNNMWEKLTISECKKILTNIIYKELEGVINI